MLNDEQIERYARQIVIPGIGAAGQQRLLESTVLVLGDPRGCSQAALYLRAAGVRVLLEPSAGQDDAGEVDLVVLTDVGTVDERELAGVIARGRPVCWYEADENGFRSGVHPQAALPRPGPGGRSQERQPSSPVHDAAACDAASVACAILCNLPWRSGPFRFDL